MLGYKSRGIAAGGAVFCCLKAGNGCNGTEVLPQFNIVDLTVWGTEFTVVY